MEFRFAKGRVPVWIASDLLGKAERGASFALPVQRSFSYAGRCWDEQIAKISRAVRCVLDELAAGRQDKERWDDLVICHYDDELLESVRRQLVRISTVPENEATFPNGQSFQIKALAEGLRQGDMSLKEREYE